VYVLLLFHVVFFVVSFRFIYLLKHTAVLKYVNGKKSNSFASVGVIFLVLMLSLGSHICVVTYTHARTQLYGTSCVLNICKKKCWNSFFAISSQHVTVMNIYSMDAAIILHICVWYVGTAQSTCVVTCTRWVV